LLHERVVELLEARHDGREVFLRWKDSCPKVEHPVFREKQQIHHFSNVLSDFLLCCCYLQTTEENQSNMSQKILVRIKKLDEGQGQQIQLRFIFFFEKKASYITDKSSYKKITYPSFCPKPEPGTVEIPVASRSLRQ
jgi:hypothetical protein